MEPRYDCEVLDLLVCESVGSALPEAIQMARGWLQPSFPHCRNPLYNNLERMAKNLAF